MTMSAACCQNAVRYHTARIAHSPPVQTLDGCLGSRERPILGADSSTVRAFVSSEPELMGEGGAYQGHFCPFPDVWDDPFKGFPQRLCPLFLHSMHCFADNPRLQLATSSAA